MKVSLNQVTRLTNILFKTKSKRIQRKLYKRISDYFFEYICEWEKDDNPDKEPCLIKLSDLHELHRFEEKL